ncbi:hypothetical protein HSX10_02305 [Winogradskyella undariae]|uniref:hypothetical protein n=1 Tax=Winogradskyella TaxID=286104 RepID=UPI00156AFB4F|nr:MULTISPECIES: hypothetical protein [Winogradskyella]NRR90395.1 hypothetical protein [Winogradskyella undariae]QXP77795.1 hypothetical protein H0I32_11225 [Winogradskyella sp. HaHa_3_26]
MKNYIKLAKSSLSIFAVLLLVLTTSCNSDDSFSFDLPTQEPTALISDATFAVSAESACKTDITITSSEFTNTIYYLFTTVGSEAPDSSTIFETGSTIVPTNGSAVFTSGNLNPSTDYIAYFITLNNDGLRSEEVSSFTYSTPEFAINVSPTYTGTSTYIPSGTGEDGYEVTVTPVDGMDYTYDVDTIWGPDFFFTLTGGQVNQGDFPGVLRFSIDPVTYDVTVVSGGEDAGQGYGIDIPYVISGSGSYDICNDIITFDLLDETLLGESVTVVLQ